MNNARFHINKYFEKIEKCYQCSELNGHELSLLDTMSSHLAEKGRLNSKLTTKLDEIHQKAWAIRNSRFRSGCDANAYRH